MSSRWNGPEWDEDPVGATYSTAQRQWRRSWNDYAVVMLGLVAVILMIPAIAMFSWLRLTGACLVLASALAVLQADRQAGTSLTRELLWSGAAVGLAGCGVLVFAGS